MAEQLICTWTYLGELTLITSSILFFITGHKLSHLQRSRIKSTMHYRSFQVGCPMVLPFKVQNCQPTWKLLYLCGMHSAWYPPSVHLVYPLTSKESQNDACWLFVVSCTCGHQEGVGAPHTIRTSSLQNYLRDLCRLLLLLPWSRNTLTGCDTK